MAKIHDFSASESTAPFVKGLPYTDYAFNPFPTSKAYGEDANGITFAVVQANRGKDYLLVLANTTALTQLELLDQDGNALVSDGLSTVALENACDPMVKYVTFKTLPTTTGIEIRFKDSTELAYMTGIQLIPMDLGLVRGFKFNVEGTYNIKHTDSLDSGNHELYRAGIDNIECPSRIECYTATATAPERTTDTFAVTCVANTWYDLVFFLDFVELTTEVLLMTLANALTKDGETFTAKRGMNKVRIFATDTAVTIEAESEAIATAMATGIKCYKVTDPTLELVSLKY